MSYNSKGNRPFEWASKSQHTHVINDPSVQNLMKRCKFPSTNEESKYDVMEHAFEINSGACRDVTTIIAVDGGYTEVTVRNNYPSSKIAFFQFGGLEFSLDDLKKLGDLPFIHPEKMEKFKKLERFKLAMPTKATSLDSLTMIESVRIPIIEFFNENRNGQKYIDTLKWLVFHEFKRKSIESDFSLSNITFGSLPKRNGVIFKDVVVNKNDIDDQGYFIHCEEIFNLIDVLRFHEVVDEELGASGILGYLTNVIEHIIIVHCIKEVITRKPSFLKKFLFIKDGPLGFFGQTAKLHKDMRELCNLCIKEYSLKLVGLEKSGSFVEHADQISSGDGACLRKGQVLPLYNNYIYKHILPGPSSTDELDKLPPYASTSYYSGKLIYRSKSDRVWVLTIPIENGDEIKKLNRFSFQNLDEILNVVEHLKCDMYENAIVPIALVNQLVSLANHPSSNMLEKFAIQFMSD
ncbi:hypothetical protein L585_04315 [Pantoea ananatis BRT175]|uniref:DNA double-strand break repair nuclease NurA n=1 Tax=Pantoea ananas TaxID=553 RepID=UPI0003B17F76|nr:DNA double-strand break repair nuclease NurA [Pantoea ananatis]ERM15497.1 hypothetical protein L585_04315 [Pantoea ananatis BRT175]